jgi:hypothetical protein
MQHTRGDYASNSLWCKYVYVKRTRTSTIKIPLISYLQIAVRHNFLVKTVFSLGIQFNRQRTAKGNERLATAPTHLPLSGHMGASYSVTNLRWQTLYWKSDGST